MWQALPTMMVLLLLTKLEEQQRTLAVRPTRPPEQQTRAQPTMRGQLQSSAQLMRPVLLKRAC